jgi:signal transduction histidine kinase
MEAVASKAPEIAQRQEPSVWRLLASVSESPTQAEAEAGLQSVLEDPTLELFVWAATEQAYVGADGSRPDLSASRNGRAVTILPHSEQPVGALVHDPRLLDVPAFHDVVAAASLAIRKDRLAEELHARIDELRRREEEVRESRRRLVEAGDAARQRLERNLHDGAQQRLVSLSLSLRLAQARLQTSPEAASEILTGASKELAVALEELRQLARGLHPAVLTERGLSAAIDSLRDSAAIDVRVGAVPSERLPEPVEAAAYYIVVEALTNAARYAGAAEARVAVTVAGGVAQVEVADDGLGGADPAGSGLRGLADRAEALGGTLLVESPPGRGTVVRASIPLAD